MVPFYVEDNIPRLKYISLKVSLNPSQPREKHNSSVFFYSANYPMHLTSKFWNLDLFGLSGIIILLNIYYFSCAHVNCTFFFIFQSLGGRCLEPISKIISSTKSFLTVQREHSLSLPSIDLIPSFFFFL